MPLATSVRSGVRCTGRAFLLFLYYYSINNKKCKVIFQLLFNKLSTNLSAFQCSYLVIFFKKPHNIAIWSLFFCIEWGFRHFSPVERSAFWRFPYKPQYIVWSCPELPCSAPFCVMEKSPADLIAVSPRA